MKRYAWAAVLVCLCLLAAGCGKGPAEPNYSDLIVPPLDRPIGEMLPAATVQEIVGEYPTITELFEDGTCLVHSGSGWRLTLNMQNTTRMGHEALLIEAVGLIPVTGLGEVAHRSEDGNTFIVYAHGYTVEVVMEGDGEYADTVLLLINSVLARLVPAA